MSALSSSPVCLSPSPLSTLGQTSQVCLSRSLRFSLLRNNICRSRSAEIDSSPNAEEKINAGVVLCSSTPPRRIASLRRRDLVLLGLTSSFALSGSNSDLLAVVSSEQDVKMKMFMDDTNAYSFAYPIELPDTDSSFKWVESRKPERYSSAAPLSPNARQRIVSERLDMIHNVVISVSIGPPNPSFLTSNDKSTWKAGDVADSVLSDKSALIPGQRMVESSILDVHSDNVGDEQYWYYEYIVRKSPTTFVQEPNLFRHNLAVTAERDGYLYSLNASTLSKQWEQIGPLLEKTVTSFRLVPPTESYVPPYKDPWRFW